METPAPTAKPRLQDLWKALRETAPQAEECIKWREPAFTLECILFMFSAITDFVVFAPAPGVVRAFAGQLHTIESTNSTVKFAIGQPLPIDLVKDMAVYCFHNFSRTTPAGCRRTGNGKNYRTLYWLRVLG
jgi:uncharacterized protein YdhG (YjbR/CyaY superfamily)